MKEIKKEGRTDGRATGTTSNTLMKPSLLHERWDEYKNLFSKKFSKSLVVVVVIPGESTATILIGNRHGVHTLSIKGMLELLVL